MTPQAETAIIQALQKIAIELGHINQKLSSLQNVPATLANIAAKTGR